MAFSKENFLAMVEVLCFNSITAGGVAERLKAAAC